MEAESRDVVSKSIDEREKIRFRFAKMTTKSVVGDEMKALEREWDRRVDASTTYMIRLDGHCFSKFTKGFEKPCDVRIHKAMSCAARDLLTTFNGTAVYTESDEMTIVFASLDYEHARATLDVELYDSVKWGRRFESGIAFGGKLQKTTTLVAGFVSARFNFHLGAQRYDDDVADAKARGGFAYFDARLFAVPCADDVARNLLWRASDAQRNSKSMLGHAHFSTSALHKLSSQQVVEKVRDELGIDYERMPKWFRAGVLIKRVNVLRDAFNPKTNESFKCTRSTVQISNWLDLVDSIDRADLAHVILAARLDVTDSAPPSTPRSWASSFVDFDQSDAAISSSSDKSNEPSANSSSASSSCN
jgi:tRNA(His) guanylyltransferase